MPGLEREEDPVDFAPREASITRSFAEAMASESLQLHKGRAVVAYAAALRAWQQAEDETARSQAIVSGLAVVEEALSLLPEDPELLHIAELLATLDV